MSKRLSWPTGSVPSSLRGQLILLKSTARLVVHTRQGLDAGIQFSEGIGKMAEDRWAKGGRLFLLCVMVRVPPRGLAF